LLPHVPLKYAPVQNIPAALFYENFPASKGCLNNWRFCEIFPALIDRSAALRSFRRLKNKKCEAKEGIE
jgi:hypothetical protein